MSTAPIESSPLATPDASTTRKGPGGRHSNMRPYTPDEQALVFQLVAAHSPKWTLIAKLVSDATKSERSAASIRNYVKRFEASKQIAEKCSAFKKLNRCQMCGQIKRGHICKPQSLEYAAPPGLSVESGDENTMRGSATPSPLAPPAHPVGGLALSCDKDGLPPLAAASLEVLNFATSPISTMETPGSQPMLSVTTLTMLADLPTPALPSAGAAAAMMNNPFPFARPAIPTVMVVEGENNLKTEAPTCDTAEAEAEAMETAPVQAEARVEVM